MTLLRNVKRLGSKVAWFLVANLIIIMNMLCCINVHSYSEHEAIKIRTTFGVSVSYCHHVQMLREILMTYTTKSQGLPHKEVALVKGRTC